MRNTFAASVLVSTLILAACGGESSTAPAAQSPAPAPTAVTPETAAATPAPAPVAEATPAPAPEPAKPVVVAAGEAKIGDTTKCLVSGEEFVVTADSPKYDYKGKTYYFHDAKGQKDFKANPKKFLAATDAKTGDTKADKTAAPAATSK